MITKMLKLTGIVSALLLSASVLSESANYEAIDRVVLNTLLNPAETDAALSILENQCLPLKSQPFTTENREFQTVQSCLWAARLADAKKQKKSLHKIAEDRIEQWSDAMKNSADGLRLRAQLLMNQMDYRGAMFQVANGNRLGALTLNAKVAAPEDERARLLRAYFELNAPKIAGGDVEAALADFNVLSQSGPAIVQFDAGWQLCDLQENVESESCKERVVQQVEQIQVNHD